MYSAWHCCKYPSLRLRSTELRPELSPAFRAAVRGWRKCWRQGAGLYSSAARFAVHHCSLRLLLSSALRHRGRPCCGNPRPAFAACEHAAVSNALSSAARRGPCLRLRATRRLAAAAGFSSRRGSGQLHASGSRIRCAQPLSLPRMTWWIAGSSLTPCLLAVLCHCSLLSDR